MTIVWHPLSMKNVTKNLRSKIKYLLFEQYRKKSQKLDWDILFADISYITKLSNSDRYSYIKFLLKANLPHHCWSTSERYPKTCLWARIYFLTTTDLCLLIKYNDGRSRMGMTNPPTQPAQEDNISIYIKSISPGTLFPAQILPLESINGCVVQS